jgi:hypothetical protein
MMTSGQSKNVAESCTSGHVKFCVYDSTWEVIEAYELDPAAELDPRAKRTITPPLKSFTSQAQGS